LQKLSGFNNEVAARASGSGRNANFICWRREKAL
jgi:hypothetical protein